MTPPAHGDTSRIGTVLPAPVETETTSDEYTISSTTEIGYHSEEARETAKYLAALLRPPTGYSLPVVEASEAPSDGVFLSLSGPPSEAGDEGYQLTATDRGVTIRAERPAGLFMGVQTLRQLLPPTIESDAERPGPWTVPGVRVLDYPRFDYRGAHLDVARHFFGVEVVKAFVDEISRYKVNHLHLHLTDNEGWRIEIDGWPRLTTHGASTDIDGGDGGYYTAAEYRDIVDYARSRHVTVVPEIDVPAHTGAAVASYPKLGRGDPDTAMPADSGTLDVDADVVYEFVEDVVRQVADLTPGPYLHVGADEADDLSQEEYARFIECVLPIVQEHGKTPVGWQEVAGADPAADVVLQHWKETDRSLAGYDLVLSPRMHAYLNFRYDEDTPPDGPETWGRRKFSVEESYDWDPGTLLDETDESLVLGTETALWSEELATADDVEFMAFPRLPGVAELGWSPDSETNWAEYKHRLAAQAPRWEERGVKFYRSPQVPWPTGE